MASMGWIMITTYVEEIGHWESWQGGYRFGTFLILPPAPPSAYDRSSSQARPAQPIDLRCAHQPHGPATQVHG